MKAKFDSFQGYKIEDNHFKIGSKIHIENFFYISRLFQNSYFSNRFALLAARFLIEKIQPNAQRNILVGYGKYSELLITRIVQILQKYYTNLGTPVAIDYDIISDAINPELLRKQGRTSDMYFIIVPIGSTLTTCIKIYNHLIENKINNKNICQPFLNIVLVADSQIEHSHNVKIHPIFKQFGWQSIDKANKIITVKVLSSKIERKRKVKSPEIVSQKYFIELNTKWHLTHDCVLCFPKMKPEEELPLIETDRASIIPQLILSNQFPFTGEEIDSEQKIKFILQPDYYYYGHQKFRGTEHIHFINPSEFLHKHKSKIIKWLENIRNDRGWSAKHNYKKVILLTPEGNLNSNFAGIVNEILFDDKANIIQYDTRNDFIQNFVNLYYKIINDADYIYYVDDNIYTGKTFRSSNIFVKQCKSNLTNTKSGFDGVISMIIRTDDFSISSMRKELVDPTTEIDKGKKILAFVYLRAPALKTNHLECPICKRQNTYQDIANSCSFNSLTVLFLEKRNQLKLIEILPEQKKTHLQSYIELSPVIIKQVTGAVSMYLLDLQRTDQQSARYELTSSIHKILYKNTKATKSDLQKISFINKYKNIIQLHISDILFDMCSKPENIERFFISKQSILDLTNETYIALNDLTLETGDKVKAFFSFRECKENIIKILSLPPFTYYSVIKTAIIRWMISEANEILKEDTDNRILIRGFSEYRYLKLILKRLSLLQSNYIIRKDTLEKISIVFRIGQSKVLSIINITKKTIDILNEIKNTLDDDDSTYIEQLLHNLTEKSRTIENYPNFIGACVKEVLHSNEFKSVFLENNVKQYYSDDIEIINSNPDFHHLIRFIKIENTSIFMNYNTYLLNYVRTKTDLHNILIDENSTNMAMQLNQMLGHSSVRGRDYEIELYTNYIALYRFLNSITNETQQISGLDIKKRIFELFPLIQNLFGLDKNSEISISINIKHEKNSLYSLDNRKKISFELDNNSFIRAFSDGISSLPNGPNQTIIEYILHKHKYETIIKDLFHKKKLIDDIEGYSEFNKKEYNRLLFFNISDIFTTEHNQHISNETQAVICIATPGSENVSDFFDCNKIRYLLLIKSMLSKFIKINVENDIFVSFIQDERKKIIESIIRHGNTKFNDVLVDKIRTLKIDGEKITELKFWIALSQQRETINNFIKYAEDNVKIQTELLTPSDLCDIMKVAMNEVFSSDIYESDSSWTKLTPEEITRFNVEICSIKQQVFKIESVSIFISYIFAEVFSNIKKHSGWFLNNCNEAKILSITVVEEQGILHIAIENNIVDFKKKYQNQIKHDGLNLIKTIYKNIFSITLDDNFAYLDETNTKFKIDVVFKSI